jgi:LPXTG-motif cell wall-anchored protein
MGIERRNIRGANMADGRRKHPTTGRWILFLLVIVAGSWWMAVPAHAFPPGEQVKIRCGELSIDPPPAPWLKVTFSGAVNGVPYSLSVHSGAPTPKIAKTPFSDQTKAKGPLTITSTAHGGWLGVSPTSKVTMTCHDPTSKSMVLAAVELPAQVLGQLPSTGGDPWFLTIVGVLLIAFGNYFVRGWRPRSRND